MDLDPGMPLPATRAANYTIPRPVEQALGQPDSNRRYVLRMITEFHSTHSGETLIGLERPTLHRH